MVKHCMTNAIRMDKVQALMGACNRAHGQRHYCQQMATVRRLIKVFVMLGQTS